MINLIKLTDDSPSFYVPFHQDAREGPGRLRFGDFTTDLRNVRHSSHTAAKANAHCNWRELMTRFELSGTADRGNADLSVGVQQRVFMCVALTLALVGCGVTMSVFLELDCAHV